jgi:hypothetical protein
VTLKRQPFRMLADAARSKRSWPLDSKTWAVATRPVSSTVTSNRTTPSWPRCRDWRGKCVGLAITFGSHAAAAVNAGAVSNKELVAKSKIEVRMSVSLAMQSLIRKIRRRAETGIDGCPATGDKVVAIQQLTDLNWPGSVDTLDARYRPVCLRDYVQVCIGVKSTAEV